MASPLLYTANTSFTLNTGIQPSSSVKRWGDYSYTSVDPNDDMTMWTLQEYVAADNRWAIRLVKLRPPPPATITTVSPATVTSGQADVTVTVTGTASSGTGFFDPGPGFASRLSAAFSGSNVKVIGVAVNSPTQVTLMLSTAGAAPGSRTLTVTNPDGQSASLAAALTVVAPPTFTVTPTSWQVPSAGGTQAVTVTASAGDAAWTASSSQPWLALSSTGGTGSGSVTLTAAPTTTVAPRTATATIAGQVVTITQAGAVPTSAVPWLTVSPAAGIGPTALTVTAQGLPGIDTRIGSVSIGGETLPVRQGPIQDQPLDLTVASVRGSTVELRWLWAGTAPDGYLLKGGLSPGETLAILPTGSAVPTFTFTASPGKFYVRMVGLRNGIELPPSADVLISVQVPEPPSAPTSLQGVATGSRLDLTWITTSNGGTATGTLLEVSGTLSGVVPLPPTDRGSFEGVPDGTYTIRARATGEAGTSEASAPITLSFPGRCELPEAAEAFHVYTTGPIVTLRWNPPASGAAATGYLLNVSGPVTVSLPVSGREFISPAPAGVDTFSVTSVNTCGQGATTATRVITVPQ